MLPCDLRHRAKYADKSLQSRVWRDNLWHSEPHPSLHICLRHATLLPLLHTLLFGFSILSSLCCSSAVWDTFQILSLIPTLPLLPDWFSHSPRPLPATTATQLSPVSFIVGMHTGLLCLRIELWESFAGSGRAQHRVWENEQLTWKKISAKWECGVCVFGGYRALFMGVTDCFYRERLWFRLYW